MDDEPLDDELRDEAETAPSNARRLTVEDAQMMIECQDGMDAWLRDLLRP